MSQQARKEWISNLRVIATVSVIVLHVASTVLYKYNSEPHSIWWIGNIYDSLVRFSVPVFLMVTGSLLLGKSESYPLFLKKKFVRIILPFIFWTSIYIIYNFIEPPQFSTRGVNQSDLSWVFQQFREGSSYHLWYIYMLMGVYLSIPLISLWTAKTKKKNMGYFLIIWAVLLIVYSSELAVTNFIWDIRYIVGYLGYAVLGYYLTLIKTKNKTITWLAIFTFITSVSITAYGTFYGTAPTGGFEKYYYAYLTPNVLLMSVSVFLIAKNVNLKPKGILLLVRNLVDKNSYGIYLVHVLVLNYLAMVGIDWYLLHPIIGIPLTVLICLIISTTVIYLISKIPFGRYISG